MRGAAVIETPDEQTAASAITPGMFRVGVKKTDTRDSQTSREAEAQTKCVEEFNESPVLLMCTAGAGARWDGVCLRVCIHF